MATTLLTWAVLLRADDRRREVPVGVEPSPERRGEAARARDYRWTGRVHRGPGGHDGRPELPIAPGSLATLRADLGVESLRPGGEPGRDRRGQSLALQRPERLPQPRPDRGPGHRAGDDRRGESQGPLVAGSPASLPPRRRQRRAPRPRESLQCLWLQHLRQRFHLPGRPVAHRRASRSPRRAWWGIASPRPSTTAPGTSWTAICTPSTCCATTRPSPASRTSSAITT